MIFLSYFFNNKSERWPSNSKRVTFDLFTLRKYESSFQSRKLFIINIQVAKVFFFMTFT